MELATYKELIRHLPYEDQSFETDRRVWEPYANEKSFSKFYLDTFSNRTAVSYSRMELFSLAKVDSYKAVFSVILWGYPKGYTLPHTMTTQFKRRFLAEGQVEFLANWLHEKRNIDAGDLEKVIKSCNGVGLSTLSKLLYFFQTNLDGNRCLIMDGRIVRNLRAGRFRELAKLLDVSESHPERKYPQFLDTCSRLAVYMTINLISWNFSYTCSGTISSPSICPIVNFTCQSHFDSGPIHK